MSKKSLGVLVLALVTLGLGLWWPNRQQTRQAAASVQAAAAPLLAGVDLNRLTTLVLADGSATTHLAKVAGNWTVVLILLMLSGVVLTVAGLRVAHPSWVDDELGV